MSILRVLERIPRVELFLAIAVLTGVLGGCGQTAPTSPSGDGEPVDEQPVDEEPPPEPADVDGFTAELPAWDEFANVMEPEKAEAGPTSEAEVFTEGDTEYSCTTTPYSLTQNPDRLVVFNPDAEILWLGGLLQGSGHMNGLGSLAELPIRQRAPLTVFIDLLTEDVTRTIEDPDPASVGSAIGELVDQAEQAGHKAGSRIFFNQKETYSLEQGSLELGISARYLGTTVKSKLSYEQSREQHTLTAYFVQQMYTASVVLPQTPGAFFSDEFTQERLDEQVGLGRMGPDNPPTFISSIVYGRMLMLTMTSTHTVEEMKAALSASRTGIGSGSVDNEHLEVLKESEIQISTVGGRDEGVEDLIETGQLGKYFDAGLSLTEARPLSYTVRNLADNSIAVVSETTEYNLKECSTSPADPTGAIYEITLDKLSLISDGCDGVFSPSPEVYYDFSLHTDDGTRTIVSRSSGSAVTISEGGSHTLPNNSNKVSLYGDGRGTLRVTGNAWDYDSDSRDERIGSWDLSWNHPISNGQRYFTRSENSCRIRLFVTITKDGDLYD